MNIIDKILPDYTRVTDALYFISGLRDINPEVLKNAAERGTRAHKACEGIIKALDPPEDITIEGYVKSFIKWNKEKRFVETSKRLYCDSHWITGELDLLYEEEDGLVLADLKTPLKESKTWKLQLSAYAYLARKAGYNIKRIEAIKLCKQGGFAKVFVYEEDFIMYLKCLDVYRSFLKDIQVENYMDYL